MADGVPKSVVVNGWMRPAWPPATGDYGEILALDGAGKEFEGVRGGYGPYSLEGSIDRVAIRSGDVPTRVTLRVLSEEAAGRILRSEGILQALSAVLLIPFLSILVGLLSPWMARHASTHRLRRTTGWIGLVIVGSPVAYSLLNAVISRIEGHYAVAPAVSSLEFLSWSASLWVGAVAVVALASLERRAIGGRLLEMRASFRAVLAAVLAVAAGWYFWILIASLAPARGPWRIDSTRDFPAAVLLALSAGICEEVVFRGFLLTRLRELTGSTGLALFATSTAFGLIHVYDSGWHALHAGVLGLILGIATLGSRNLFPAILAHAGWNLLWTVSLAFDVVRGLA